MSRAITSYFILWSLFGSTTKIYFMLSLISIKWNHIVSTVKQLPPNDTYFSLLYVKNLAGKLNPDLKANLNGHPSICHSIQIWIRLKKLYFHGKWQNHFTHKSASTSTICRNFIWMKNWNYITIFSAKFQNQCKEQINDKKPSNILP